MKNQDMGKCWLCEREFYTQQGRFPVGPPTKHHVIPRQKYRGRWQDADVVFICKMCQRQMHKMFTNNELKAMAEKELKHHNKILDYYI